MVSWLYGLLFGLGIASGILAFGALMAGVIIKVETTSSIVAIICFSLIPVLIIASAVLISICVCVGKI